MTKPVPDTTGAVGPNHAVDFADSWFMVHDQTTGQAVLQMTMSNFWMFVEPSNTFVLAKPNDPRMLYDTLCGRWFASCAEDATQHRLSVCIMMHAIADPPGTMRPGVKAVPGTTYFRYAKYKVLPWGNYSATCVDPSDPIRLWTYQEYANSTNDGQWCTAWASFQLDPTK